jgi:hypothetical protein
MNRRKKNILFVLLLFVLTGVIWFNLTRSDQYTIGMSVAEVRLRSHDEYQLHKLPIGFSGSPTPDERKSAVVNYMYDSRCGVILYFNDYQELVKKRRIRYFWINIPKLVDYLRMLSSRYL